MRDILRQPVSGVKELMDRGMYNRVSVTDRASGENAGSFFVYFLQEDHAGIFVGMRYL